MLRATFVPSNTGYSVSLYLSEFQFSVTGFNAYNLGLSFNPVLAELLTTATSTNSGDLPTRFAGDIVAVNTQRLSAGEIQVAGLSSRAEALPASTALGTLSFGNVASSGLSVTVNKLVVGSNTYIQGDKPLTFNSDGSRFTPDIYSFPFNRSAANLQFNTQDSRWSFTDANGKLINLNSFKRVEFADANIALDVLGSNSAGGIFRLYQAALNRTPDQEGLGFWIKWADSGAVDAVTMASRFIWETEFKQLYNVNPRDDYLTGANLQSVVSKMYENVLKRAPDPAGLNFYVGTIQSKEKTAGRVLAEISDSPENFQLTLVGVQNGIQYQEYQGVLPSL